MLLTKGRITSRWINRQFLIMMPVAVSPSALYHQMQALLNCHPPAVLIYSTAPPAVTLPGETYTKWDPQTSFNSLCAGTCYAQGHGWIDGWVEVRHDPHNSNGRARKVLTVGKTSMQDMLTLKQTENRFDIRSLILWGSFQKPKSFLTTVFLSYRCIIRHTKRGWEESKLLLFSFSVHLKVILYMFSWNMLKENEIKVPVNQIIDITRPHQ